jgi:hypothetical protein
VRELACPLNEISWSLLLTFPETILSSIAMFLGGEAKVCSLMGVRRRGRRGGRGLT